MLRIARDGQLANNRLADNSVIRLTLEFQHGHATATFGEHSEREFDEVHFVAAIAEGFESLLFWLDFH